MMFLFLFTLFYNEVYCPRLLGSLVAKLGSVDLALKYKIVYYWPLSGLPPSLSTLAANVPYSSTVVTSFWKSKRLTCLFVWILCILSLAYNVILTVRMWILVTRRGRRPRSRSPSIRSWFRFVGRCILFYSRRVFSLNTLSRFMHLHG